MRSLLSVTIFLAVLVPAFAKDRIAGPIEARIIKVQDGDSLIVLARIWPGQDVRAHVRLRGLDAPELRAKCEAERIHARLSRDYLRQLTDGRRIYLKRIEAGKYFGRVLADVSGKDGTDFADLMVQSGLARPYQGRRRGSWCKGIEVTGIKRIIP